MANPPDGERESETTSLPDCAATEIGPGANFLTSAAPTRGAASLAWSDDDEVDDDEVDDDEVDDVEVDNDQQSWRNTAAIATALALVGGAVGAAVWFGHATRSIPQAQSTTVTSTVAVALTPTTTVPPSPPPPPPPPSTPWGGDRPVTKTVVVEAPSYTPGNDQQMLAGLVHDHGWTIWDPASVIQNAHHACDLMEQGVPIVEVTKQAMANTGMSTREAAQFTTTASYTYPNC